MTSLLTRRAHDGPGLIINGNRMAWTPYEYLIDGELDSQIPTGASFCKPGTPLFMDDVFHDSQFMSAREKRLVLKGWVRFLKNGLRFEDFSDRLYRHLTLHCSFIAHYDRAGFYAEYFERGAVIKMRFSGRGFAPRRVSNGNEP